MDNNSGFFVGANDVAQYLVSVGKDLQNARAVSEQTIIEVGGVKMYWNTSNRRWEPIIAPVVPDEPLSLIHI